MCRDDYGLLPLGEKHHVYMFNLWFGGDEHLCSQRIERVSPCGLYDRKRHVTGSCSRRRTCHIVGITVFNPWDVAILFEQRLLQFTDTLFTKLTGCDSPL